MRQDVALISFNRGLLSRFGLARIDLKRTALSAEAITNWMPRTLGSMGLRVGLGYLDGIRNNAFAVHLPFVFSNSDTAVIELTDSVMRVRVAETIISRVAVSSAISNGTFNTDLSGWTSADETGATSAWATGGYMSLTGTTFNAAKQYQQVTVSAGDRNVEHALRIVVQRGLMKLRVGSTNGGDDYITETDLLPGTHSLALTPAGNFYIQLSSYTPYATLVDSVTIESSGAMEIPTPWPEASLRYVRVDQSADVIFASCNGYQQRRIERRGTRSWSVALYQPEDGPFRSVNTGPITLTPSALTGDITLTASASLFRSGHVGALFRIASIGQKVTASLSGTEQYTNAIRVTGTSTQRAFTIDISGTWTATVTLQRSTDQTSWTDVTSYTSNQSGLSYNDGLDNQILYYRLGIKTGNYTSGTAVCSETYASGSLTGIVRITGYTSATSVSASVLTALGGTAASSTWNEGEWSDYRGYPTCDVFYDGRFWEFGRDKSWGSVSDGYSSFDDTVEGDSGPINRSIGSGPVDNINWALPLERLVIGGDAAEYSIRSSSLDEPLTPTNFNIKSSSTRGSAAVAAVKVDSMGLFVDAGGTKLMELSIDSGSYNGTYKSTDLTLLVPEVGKPSIVKIAVQRRPDTRIHCVRSDGAVAVLVYDPAEEVKGWLLVETDGTVEDVVVIPGGIEDSVYYTVNRTINGSTARYFERWALESDCVGGTLNKQADSFVTYSGVATTMVSAPHLAGETVVVWADGRDKGTLTLDGSGNGTLSEAVTNYCVGLGYTARFKSTKLSYSLAELTQKKKLDHLGVILANTHAQGLRYGPDFDNLDDLPLVENGALVDADSVWENYDQVPFEFPGTFDSDSRLCLEAAAPRPCTILAATLPIETHVK